jgi:hypothetical protein
MDREGRDAVLRLVETFQAGNLTDHGLVDAVGRIRSGDPIVGAMRDRLWWILEGLTPKRLAGGVQLTMEQRRALEVCIVFLRSDQDYVWPWWRLRLSPKILRLVGLSASSGAWEAGNWPFVTEADFLKAKRRQEGREQGS